MWDKRKPFVLLGFARLPWLYCCTEISGHGCDIVYAAIDGDHVIGATQDLYV